VPFSRKRRCLIATWYARLRRRGDIEGFVRRVGHRYTLATLERLAQSGEIYARRGAVLAIGHIGTYRSNSVLGVSLVDHDRGVRVLADEAIRKLWGRIGSPEQQQLLRAVADLNRSGLPDEAIEESSRLIGELPWCAEAWHQRGLARYEMGHFELALGDFQQALAINAFHFAAAEAVGLSLLQLGRPQAALESLRRAVRLNPGLEKARCHIARLQRLLGEQASE
jgi:tetratricopeptide (TPR) repeat protein